MFSQHWIYLKFNYRCLFPPPLPLLPYFILFVRNKVARFYSRISEIFSLPEITYFTYTFLYNFFFLFTETCAAQKQNRAWACIVIGYRQIRFLSTSNELNERVELRVIIIIWQKLRESTFESVFHLLKKKRGIVMKTL